MVWNEKREDISPEHEGNDGHGDARCGGEKPDQNDEQADPYAKEGRNIKFGKHFIFPAMETMIGIYQPVGSGPGLVHLQKRVDAFGNADLVRGRRSDVVPIANEENLGVTTISRTHLSFLAGNRILIIAFLS